MAAEKCDSEEAEKWTKVDIRSEWLPVTALQILRDLSLIEQKLIAIGLYSAAVINTTSVTVTSTVFSDSKKCIFLPPTTTCTS